MSVLHVVLRCLMDGPSHGYALQKQVAHLRHFYPLNNVNIYPVLRDLETQGCVRSHTEIANSRARKVYALTPEGENTFSSWVEHAPDDHFPFQQDLVGLKLLLATEGNAGDFDWLEGVLGSLEKEIDRIRKRIEDDRATGTRLSRLTLEWRLDAYLLRRDFLNRALQIVRDASGG